MAPSSAFRISNMKFTLGLPRDFHKGLSLHLGNRLENLDPNTECDMLKVAR